MPRTSETKNGSLGQTFTHAQWLKKLKNNAEHKYGDKKTVQIGHMLTYLFSVSQLKHTTTPNQEKRNEYQIHRAAVGGKPGHGAGQLAP
jgi:hypothetical protein